jgi:hypothetical protein
MVRASDRLEDVRLLPTDADTRLSDGALQTWKPWTPIVLRDGQFVRPDVVDAIEAARENPWHPNSPRARLLVACVQAVKDITVAARAIDAENPWRERRPVALLATPLVTLCDHTKDLYGRLGQEHDEHRRWPEADKKVFREAGRRLKKHVSGLLRTLRHERTGHLDVNVLRRGAPVVPLLEPVLLPAMGDALLVLILCFNHRRVYTWVKQAPGGAPNEVEITSEYPLVFRASLAADGGIASFGDVATLGEDPCGPLRDHVLDLVDVYNHLASKAAPGHPTIFVREWPPEHRHRLRAQEQNSPRRGPLPGARE